MASEIQRSYIKDLAVQRLKEFKEFKEMIVSAKIVSPDSKTVMGADSIDVILDATTDLQASKMIDELLLRKPPVRSRTYSNTRARKTDEALQRIRKKIGDWDFDELRRIS